MVPLVEMLTCWPGDPWNVSRAFWPGTVVVTGTVEPPTVIVPTTSLKRYGVMVAWPVEVPGEMTRAYVPVAGNRSESRMLFAVVQDPEAAWPDACELGRVVLLGF